MTIDLVKKISNKNKEKIEQLCEITENEFIDLCKQGIDSINTKINRLEDMRQQLYHIYSNYLHDSMRYKLTFYQSDSDMYYVKREVEKVGFIK